MKTAAQSEAGTVFPGGREGAAPRSTGPPASTSLFISSATLFLPSFTILIGFPVLVQPNSALGAVCATFVGFKIN